MDQPGMPAQPEIPDGYGLVYHQRKWWLVKGLFYSSDIAYNRLRGLLCNVSPVMDHRGVPRSFDSPQQAATWFAETSGPKTA